MKYLTILIGLVLVSGCVSNVEQFCKDRNFTTGKSYDSKIKCYKIVDDEWKQIKNVIEDPKIWQESFHCPERLGKFGSINCNNLCFYDFSYCLGVEDMEVFLE